MKFFDISTIRNLIEIVVESGFDEIEIKSWGRRVYIKNSETNKKNIVPYKIDELRRDFYRIYNGAKQWVARQKKLNGGYWFFHIVKSFE